jgi:hypothetical protein
MIRPCLAGRSKTSFPPSPVTFSSYQANGRPRRGTIAVGPAAVAQRWPDGRGPVGLGSPDLARRPTDGLPPSPPTVPAIRPPIGARRTGRASGAIGIPGVIFATSRFLAPVAGLVVGEDLREEEAQGDPGEVDPLPPLSGREPSGYAAEVGAVAL